MNMNKEILSATTEALKIFSHKRFYSAERGYQGKFYQLLHNVLDEAKILNDEIILEQEYQKSARHHLPEDQRPDIVLHVPAEFHNLQVTEGNFAVFALKRQATKAEARDDFRKLNHMFEHLKYPLGIFININSNLHRLELYEGNYKKNIHSFAVWLEDDEVKVIHAFWRDENNLAEKKY